MRNKLEPSDKKRIFTNYLSHALETTVPFLKYIEYKAMPEKTSEFIRITYKEGGETIIDVTGTDPLYILKAITQDLCGEEADGVITDRKHKDLIKGWWTDEADPED